MMMLFALMFQPLQFQWVLHLGFLLVVYKFKKVEEKEVTPLGPLTFKPKVTMVCTLSVLYTSLFLFKY